jgi:hypothetical protein
MANAARDKVVSRAEDIERQRRWRARSPAGLAFRAAAVVTSVLPASGALTPNKPSESGSAQAKVVRPYGDHAAPARSESIAAEDMTVSGRFRHLRQPQWRRRERPGRTVLCVVNGANVKAENNKRSIEVATAAR